MRSKRVVSREAALYPAQLSKLTMKLLRYTA